MMFLVMIALIDAAVIGAMVGSMNRSLVSGLVVGVACAAAFWGFVLGIGTMLVRFGTWEQLWRRYPGGDNDAFGPGSRIISVSLRHPWWQINNAVEARADDAHLHLRIAFPVLGDNHALSIPWEAVRFIAPASLGRAKLDVEGIAIWVPRVLVKNELVVREAMEVGEAPGGGPAPEGAS